MPAASVKPKTFLQKIAAASAEMDNPKKRATNPHFKSKFANLSDTMDVIEPVLERYNLWHKATFHGTNFVYTVYDLDSDEVEFSSIDLSLLLAELEGNVWQQIGQAFTYLRRYLAQAYWGLVPDDDDAQSAPSRPAAQRKTQAAKTDYKPDYNDLTPRNSGDGGGAL